LAFKKTVSNIIISIIIVFSIGTGIWLVQRNYSLEPTKGEVFITYAGSLTRTFESSIGPSFEKDTGYTYVGEGRGSVQLANMIIDKQRDPDVFVSANTAPIMRLIDHDPPLAQWLVKFASAEMVIAYPPNSHFFNDLERARKGEIAWYDVLSENGLKFRRTDPELDPKGYYMIVVANLANIYYNNSMVKDRILGEDRNSSQLLPEESLLSTLEQGQIDAAATYKHEAIARGLPYITLPKEINLSDPTFSNFYNQVSYALGSGQTIRGDTIDFSLTIPQTSKNIGGSIAFVRFLLSEKGMDILKAYGMNPIKSVGEGQVEKIPPVIRELLAS
jgi:molybdate/tungstate transport system substrate-binding protein